MSYGVATALQEAVFTSLSGDVSVTVPVYDALPAGVLPETYVILGTEEVTTMGDSVGAGAQHDFTVSVVSRAPGFATAKGVGVAISDLLLGASLSLSRGSLAGLWLRKATARRLNGGTTRQIDLRFRALTDDF